MQTTTLPVMRPATRMDGLSESQTLALAKKVREMRAAGKDVISLTLGEPDFDTPAHIRQAAIAAINQGFTHYPPVAGIPELREAVATFMRTHNNLPYKAENILVSTGAKQSIVNAIMALINPGDEVVLAAPYWVSYYPMVKMAEGVPVVVQSTQENALKITPEQLERAITPRTRMFILNTPSNPTGMMYTPAEVAALAEVLRRHPHVFIISDEIYELIAYAQKHVSIGTFPDLFDRVITIDGLSKGFAMTGWRVGFTAAPKWILDLCEKFQGQVTSGANSIAQKAALCAVTSDLGPTHTMVAAFRKRRDLLCSLMQQHMPAVRFVKPDGAFYLYPDISAWFGKKTPQGTLIQNGDDWAMHALQHALVSTVPGSAFGTNQHVRISYACSEQEITLAVQRLAECFDKVK